MTLSSKKTSPFAILVAGLLLFRAFLNGVIPLMDKTEARYSEIARIMSETGNWVTLQIDYGIPFWAKPPLSTWLSAISFNIFGVNEFAARFPYLFLNIIIILLIGKYAKRKGLDFFIPGFILLTIPEFLIHTGVVSTDTALAFSVTLVMISFWEGINNKNNNVWKYLFFVGIGLGLLAKGPIIIILTGPPIFVWLLMSKKFKDLWKSFPWVIGVLITAIIAVPWYYLAEQRTPGFFDYFIIGEHFKRFLDSSWQGDKYGYPKQQAMGMIWVFLFVFSLPWIQLLIVKLWKNRSLLIQNKWVLFLLLWLIWTPLFFTVSKSLIHPYIMPIMVPIALLITYWWKQFKSPKTLVKGALVFPGLALVFYIVVSFSSQKEYYINSDKHLIENNNVENIPIYHWDYKSYSGQFYTKGKIKAMEGNKDLKDHLLLDEAFLIIIPTKFINDISQSNLQQLEKVDENYKKNMYIYTP